MLFARLISYEYTRLATIVSGDAASAGYQQGRRTLQEERLS